MSTIAKFLASDHARCDELFSFSQGCVEREDWAQAETAFRKFDAAFRSHLAMEEEALFPAFEQITGNTSGPTAVMRMEHAQLRGIVDDGHAALATHDASGFFAAADTLQVMMGQHNLKEESVLYPMSDRMLAHRVGEVLTSMQTIAGQPVPAPTVGGEPS